MFNKRTPLHQLTVLSILVLLMMALSACGADDKGAAETGRKFVPAQNAQNASPAESGGETSLRFAKSSQPRALEIWVDNARNLYAVDLEIRFNPAKLQLADADAAQEGIQLQPGQTPAPDFIASNSGDNQTGVAHYVITQVAPREGFNGSGLIATLLWEGQVDPAAVFFGQITLVDQNGQPIQATAQNAKQAALSMN